MCAANARPALPNPNLPGPDGLIDLVEEADRQLTVCNACRYCEGYCAVFPAMEKRRTFEAADIVYMANLCFECRACYYACQFAPPHEYGINIPQVMSAVRTATYAEYTGPALLQRLYKGNTNLVFGTVLVAIAITFFGALAVQGAETMFGVHTDSGSFYKVVPYFAMLVPALVLSGVWLGAFALGAVRFWRSMKVPLIKLIDVPAFVKASKDAFSLRYLEGDGEGCTYPTSQFSQSRRYAHHALLLGIVLDFASTTVAAFYDHFLGREAPYAYLSLPVMLGTVGGVLIVVGVVGLWGLKLRADPAPAYREMLRQDAVFLILLLLTSVTGLILLVLRDTAAMGTLLAVHLGIVAALFLTLPYGKFAHVVYRYAALIRYRLEEP